MDSLPNEKADVDGSVSEVGTIDWFLEQCDNTPEEKELKRKAWDLMGEGNYNEALKILWKHFPEEYPIPEKEQEYCKSLL